MNEWVKRAEEYLAKRKSGADVSSYQAAETLLQLLGKADVKPARIVLAADGNIVYYLKKKNGHRIRIECCSGNEKKYFLCNYPSLKKFEHTDDPCEVMRIVESGELEG